MGWDMCSPQYFVQVFFKAHELEICRLMIGNKHFFKNQRIQMCYFTYLYKGGGARSNDLRSYSSKKSPSLHFTRQPTFVFFNIIHGVT